MSGERKLWVVERKQEDGSWTIYNRTACVRERADEIVAICQLADRKLRVTPYVPVLTKDEVDAVVRDAMDVAFGPDGTYPPSPDAALNREEAEGTILHALKTAGVVSHD